MVSSRQSVRVLPRYESLDAWRGIACLLVISFHATLDAPTTGGGVAAALVAAMRWGRLGVPIFFVISGYCIAASLDAERLRGAGAGAFLVRRAWRIYPPYWVVLLISAAVVALVEGCVLPGFFSAGNHPIAAPQSLTGSQWIGALTLTETWRHHLAGAPSRHLLGHSWSLCYEIQFYSVAAVALWAARRRLFAALGVLTAAILMGRHIVWQLAPAHYLDGFFVDGTWLTFAAGALVYCQVAHRSRLGAIATRLLLAAGVAYALRRPSAVESQLLIAFGFALVVSLLWSLDSRLATAPSLRPLSACGKMGYSLYLVHWPIVKALDQLLRLAGVTGAAGTLCITLPLCMVVSVAAAGVFHRWVEQRIHHGSRGRQVRLPRESSACIGRRSSEHAVVKVAIESHARLG
jgi:peptidoglycan/LPS O-acetylase OafA/YrhL